MANINDNHVINRFLSNLGDDALANFYTIIIPKTIAGSSLYKDGNLQDPLTFRIHSVSIPERTVNTYDITKRGRRFSRPNGINEQSREVSFSFHPDRAFLTYRVLSAWMTIVQDNVSMYMGADCGTNGSTIRADVVVKSIKSLDGNDIQGNSIEDAVWVLEKAFITSLGGIEFDDETGEPLDVTVTLNCFNIIYPGEPSGTAFNIATSS